MKLFAVLAVLLIQLPGQIRLQTGTVRGEIRGLDGLPATGVRVTAAPVQATGDAAAAPDTMAVLTETDGSGRYILGGIPPGRYIITAGLIDSPTYYPGVNSRESAQAVSVTAAGTIDGINFALARSAGARVTGRLKGFGDGLPSGLIRLSLMGASATRVQPQEAVVRSDGTFEFLKVAPGAYNLRVSPSLQPGAATRVEVQDRDIDSLSIDIGNATFLAGKMVMDDGSPLPQRSLLPGMPDVAFVTAGAQPLSTTIRNGAAVTPVRASDGAFLVMVPEGEYSIGLIQMPLGYSVQSISHGAVDLLQSPLKIANSPSADREGIRITLTTTPPKTGPAWRRISGRVFGVPAGLAPQHVVLVENVTPSAIPIVGSPRRMGEIAVRDDGTFELTNVPPGSYSLRVLRTVPGMVGSTVGILVGEADVNGVELMAPEPPKASSTVASPPQPLSPDMLTRGTLPSTQPAGVKVGGTVTLAAVNDRTLMPHTAVLFRASGQTFQAAIQSNGTFEFHNVPPGAYDMRVLPLSLPNESTPVLVDTREVTGVRVALPPLSNLRGRVRADDGRTPPDFSGMTLKLASSLVEIELPLGTDGEFGTRVAHGEYTFSASSVPAGYTVSPGSIVVDAPATKEITIGLRANP